MITMYILETNNELDVSVEQGDVHGTLEANFFNSEERPFNTD